MIDYFNDVYLKRINRYGNNRQQRILSKREQDFEIFLKSSIRATSIWVVDRHMEGVLEPNKQDAKETSAYFLVRKCDNLESGFIFEEPRSKTEWMVLFAVSDISRGYNKFLVARIDSEIRWGNIKKGETLSLPYKSKCYLFGPMNKVIVDRFRNYKSEPAYREDIKNVHVIMPFNKDLQKDSYIEINGESYLVTGFDKATIKGIMYVSLDATFERNQDDFPPDALDGFWLRGV